MIALLVMCVLGLGAVKQDAPGSRDFRERLEALRPENPLAYFELAEEVGDGAAGDVQRLDLARRLYGLAGVLDTPRLGHSACLALADLENQPHVKRRLVAMASLLGSERNVVNLLSDTAPTDTIDPRAALSVTEAFSHYRRGLGSRALSALRDQAAMELLQSIGHLLRGGTQRFLEDCKLYNGQVRPSLSEPLRANMLHLERALLSGEQREWSSELLLKAGVPLIEIDPRNPRMLAELLGVDPEMNVWRGGRWGRGE